MKNPLKHYINNSFSLIFLSSRRKTGFWSLVGMILLAGLMFMSCNTSTPSPENDVIARYKQQYLYRGEVNEFTPPGLSKEDSANFANKYIEGWIRAKAIEEKALSSIPDLEEKIAHRLNSVRSRLIEYEFDSYVARKELYAKVADSELRNYFSQYPEKFISKANYYAYFHVQMKSAPTNRHLGLLNSTETNRIGELREWCEENQAILFKLDSTFVPEMQLESIATGFPFDIKRSGTNQVYSYKSINEEANDTSFHIFKMLKKIKEGDPKPYALCKGDIEQIILSQRKNRLLERTKGDLLQQALNGKKITQFNQ